MAPPEPDSQESLSVQTTFVQLMLDHAAKRPQGAALREKEYGIWQTTTWSELAQVVRAMACGLAAAARSGRATDPTRGRAQNGS